MNIRAVAASVLARVLGGASLTAALEAALPTLAKPQDRAFVQAASFGALRHFHQLDFLLGLLLAKPLPDPKLKALALLGLYQLAFMRVKPHAAVAETVAAVGNKTWAKPVLNAVLRRYLREQHLLADQIARQPAAALSHPDWLLQTIDEDWPGQMRAIATANNQPPPMALRVNLARTSRRQYLGLLDGRGIAAAEVAASPCALVLATPVPVDKLPGFGDGLVSVQDSAAQLAAGLLRLAAGQRVLDICAAPGGKTAHILEAQPGLGELVAVDIDPQRMLKVACNLKRLGLAATLAVGDARAPGQWWDGRPFDRILVDAPCSATGVIRRHPDIKLLRQPADIGGLQALQASILQAAWPLLAPGGLLLYATCSLLKQENEAQIAAFLAAHADAQALPLADGFGHARPHGRQIITGDDGMDGFYYALLAKRP